MVVDWGVLAFFLLVLALVLILAARGIRARTGLPRGRVIYTDTARSERPMRPLFSVGLNLAGRPDYLVTQGRELIPVEVKSRPAPPEPYPSHVLQLGAYCVLVEETTGRRPPYGILRYADRSFEIPFTKDLETRVLETLEAMRADLKAGDAPRDHDDSHRCRACAYREQCPESLM